jgi:hypothetical protein
MAYIGLIQRNEGISTSYDMSVLHPSPPSPTVYWNE